MKITEKEAKKIQSQLIKFAKRHDISGAVDYIKSHSEEINKIVDKYGSASQCLTAAYDIANDKKTDEDYEFASQYQVAIEEINDVALFGEDGQ